MAPPKLPPKPANVPEYIAAAPQEARKKLRELRKCIRAAAPGSVENLKWGMPAYSYRRIVIMYAAFKQHVSIFPGTPTVRAFKKELTKYMFSSATIQFPFDQPLPLALIRRITKARVQDCVKRDGKWRTKP